MTDEIIVVACGSRHLHIGSGPNEDYPVTLGGSREEWWPLLDELHQLYGWTQLWHGGGAGADQSVAIWAAARGLRVEAFPAPWDLFKAAKVPAKAAGPRRIEDMLMGRRGYELVPPEEDASAGGIRTTEQLDGIASHLLALPGFKGTRRTIRMAKEQSFMVHRVSAEPWVVNGWHYSRRARGKVEYDLPRPFTWIQRGQSALANPWEMIQDAETNLEAYEAYLGALLRRSEPHEIPRGWRTPHWRDVYRALDRITCDHVLVCTCVTDDGSVDMATGKGRCHGHSVVKAWRWWQAHPELSKYL